MNREITMLTGSLFLSLAIPLPTREGIRVSQILSHPYAAARPFPFVQDSSPLPYRKIIPVNEEVLKSCCEKLEKDRRRIYYLTARSYRMSMQLKGVYTREGMMFFRLALCNHSNLDYDADSIRFYIRDSRPQPDPGNGGSLFHRINSGPLFGFGHSQPQPVAGISGHVQNARDSHAIRMVPAPAPAISLSPLYVHGNTRLVKGKSKEQTVIVLPRFTLQEGKTLIIEVLEKNGGRRLQLQTGNNTLVNSRLI